MHHIYRYKQIHTDTITIYTNMASYQGRRLLLERSGMNALLATPIPVPNGDS